MQVRHTDPTRKDKIIKVLLLIGDTYIIYILSRQTPAGQQEGEDKK